MARSRLAQRSGFWQDAGAATRVGGWDGFGVSSASSLRRDPRPPLGAGVHVQEGCTGRSVLQGCTGRVARRGLWSRGVCARVHGEVLGAGLRVQEVPGCGGVRAGVRREVPGAAAPVHPCTGKSPVLVCMYIPARRGLRCWGAREGSWCRGSRAGGAWLQGCTCRGAWGGAWCWGAGARVHMQGCTCRGALRDPWCWNAHAGVRREISDAGVHMQSCTGRFWCWCARTRVHKEIHGAGLHTQGRTVRSPVLGRTCSCARGGPCRRGARAGVYGEVPDAGARVRKDAQRNQLWQFACARARREIPGGVCTHTRMHGEIPGARCTCRGAWGDR